MVSGLIIPDESYPVLLLCLVRVKGVIIWQYSSAQLVCSLEEAQSLLTVVSCPIAAAQKSEASSVGVMKRRDRVAYTGRSLNSWTVVDLDIFCRKATESNPAVQTKKTQRSACRDAYTSQHLVCWRTGRAGETHFWRRRENYLCWNMHWIGEFLGYLHEPKREPVVVWGDKSGGNEYGKGRGGREVHLVGQRMN